MATNLERWNFYLQDFGSPQNFKDWGFYSLISSVLQRRVYLGSTRKELFGNMYTILTGPAGVGKGMVLGEVGNILRHPKMRRIAGLEQKKDQIKDELEQAGVELRMSSKEHNTRLQNMLVPMAPNATTFEALTNIIAQCNQPLRYIDHEGNKRMSSHSSICIHLEELGSLFRKHTEDIHTLLCELYDCKDPYEYRTKHQGIDYIRRPCVNILAGTTPDFLRRVFSSSLLTEGFASRTVFVVAMKNAFKRFETPVWSVEQQVEHELIVDHVVNVARLQGCCKFSPDALAFAKSIWEDPDFDTKRANPNPKLNAYYARKNITLAKLSMAIHFGDSVEMEIPLSAIQTAAKVLEEAELTMHHALHTDTKNPLSQATDAILKYIITHKVATKKNLKFTFYDDFPNDPSEDLDKILNFLCEQGKIKEDSKPNTYILIEKEKDK